MPQAGRCKRLLSWELPWQPGRGKLLRGHRLGLGNGRAAPAPPEHSTLLARHSPLPSASLVPPCPGSKGPITLGFSATAAAPGPLPTFLTMRAASLGGILGEPSQRAPPPAQVLLLILRDTARQWPWETPCQLRDIRGEGRGRRGLNGGPTGGKQGCNSTSPGKSTRGAPSPAPSVQLGPETRVPSAPPWTKWPQAPKQVRQQQPWMSGWLSCTLSL